MKAILSIMALSALLSACVRPGVQAQSPADLRASAEVAGQVRRCYRSPRVPSAGKRIVTRLLARYAPDGTLVGVPLLVWQQGVTPESRPFAGRMTEAAALAIVRCSPIRVPAKLGKRRASEFYLTFSPQLRA